eukprot:GHVH01005499.1.p1 GENE.GHVH01005499.1~~GHVH01005499.1.p1  ORF type:complete len:1835 (+),score=246.06 GHVH01005499.1:58-5562(+)
MTSGQRRRRPGHFAAAADVDKDGLDVSPADEPAVTGASRRVAGDDEQPHKPLPPLRQKQREVLNTNLPLKKSIVQTEEDLESGPPTSTTPKRVSAVNWYRRIRDSASVKSVTPPLNGSGRRSGGGDDLLKRLKSSSTTTNRKKTVLPSKDTTTSKQPGHEFGGWSQLIPLSEAEFTHPSNIKYTTEKITLALPIPLQAYNLWCRAFYSENDTDMAPDLEAKILSSLPESCSMEHRAADPSTCGEVTMRLTNNLFASFYKRSLSGFSVYGLHRAKVQFCDKDEASIVEWIVGGKDADEIMILNLSIDMSSRIKKALKEVLLRMPLISKYADIYSLNSSTTDDHHSSTNHRAGNMTLLCSVRLKASHPVVILRPDHYLRIEACYLCLAAFPNPDKAPLNDDYKLPLGFQVTVQTGSKDVNIISKDKGCINWSSSNITLSTGSHRMPQSKGGIEIARWWLEESLLSATLMVPKLDWLANPDDSDHPVGSAVDKGDTDDDDRIHHLDLEKLSLMTYMTKLISRERSRKITMADVSAVKRVMDSHAFTASLPLLAPLESLKLLDSLSRLSDDLDLTVSTTSPSDADANGSVRYINHVQWWHRVLKRHWAQIWHKLSMAVVSRTILSGGDIDKDELIASVLKRSGLDQWPPLELFSAREKVVFGVIHSFVSTPYHMDLPYGILRYLTPIDRSFFVLVECFKMIPRYIKQLQHSHQSIPSFSCPLLVRLVKMSYRHSCHCWDLLRCQATRQLTALQISALERQLFFSIGPFITILKAAVATSTNLHVNAVLSYDAKKLVKSTVKRSHDDLESLTSIMNDICNIATSNSSTEWGDMNLFTSLLDDHYQTQPPPNRNAQDVTFLESISQGIHRCLIWRGLSMERNDEVMVDEESVVQSISTAVCFVSHCNSPLPSSSTSKNEEEDDDDRVDVLIVNKLVDEWIAAMAAACSSDHTQEQQKTLIRIIGGNKLGECGLGPAVRVPLNREMYTMFASYKEANSRLFLEAALSGRFNSPIIAHWTTPSLRKTSQVMEQNLPFSDSYLLRIVEAADALTPVGLVSVGYHHTVVVSPCGEMVTMWGSNSGGQITGCPLPPSLVHLDVSTAIYVSPGGCVDPSDLPRNTTYNHSIVPFPITLQVVRHVKQQNNNNVAMISDDRKAKLLISAVSCTRSSTLILTKCGRLLVIGGGVDGLRDVKDTLDYHSTAEMWVSKRREWKYTALWKLFRQSERETCCCSGGGLISPHSIECNNFDLKNISKSELPLNYQEPFFSRVCGGESHATAMSLAHVMVWGRGEAGQLGLPLTYLTRLWHETEIEVLKRQKAKLNVGRNPDTYGLVPLLMSLRVFEVEAWELSHGLRLNASSICCFIDGLQLRNPEDEDCIDIRLDLRRMVWMVTVPDELVPMSSTDFTRKSIIEEIDFVQTWAGECNSFFLGVPASDSIPRGNQNRPVDRGLVLYACGQMDSGQLGCGLSADELVCVLELSDSLNEGKQLSTPVATDSPLRRFVEKIIEKVSIEDHRGEVSERESRDMMLQLAQSLRWTLMPRLSVKDILSLRQTLSSDHKVGRLHPIHATASSCRQTTKIIDGGSYTLETFDMLEVLHSRLRSDFVGPTAALVERAHTMERLLPLSSIDGSNLEEGCRSRFSMVPVNMDSRVLSRDIEMNCGGASMVLWTPEGRALRWGKTPNNRNRVMKNNVDIVNRSLEKLGLDENEALVLFGDYHVDATPRELAGTQWKHLSVSKGSNNFIFGVVGNELAMEVGRNEVDISDERLFSAGLFNELDSIPTETVLKTILSSQVATFAEDRSFRVINPEPEGRRQLGPHKLQSVDCGLGFMVAKLSSTRTEE